MATIVLAPDSFKGSASAVAVARALADGLTQSLPGVRLLQAPMADGGEGTLDCIAAAFPGHWRTTPIKAIHGENVNARWYQTNAGLAVIESATVLGLPLVEASAHAPPLAARGSFALGRLLHAVLDEGARRIAVGLGGSACNDAGLGLLLALGADARDRSNKTVPPTMAGLLAVDRLNLAGLDARLAHTELSVFCDVDNPLLGADGASRVYGPQKGLTEARIEAVEAAFTHIATACGERGAAKAPGSGAAGGLGFALAVLGARLDPGANTLMALTDLPATLAAADLVVTGEGRSDTQTLAGKLPLAIARAAAPIPTVLVAGTIEDAARRRLETHFAACFALIDAAGSVAAAHAEPQRWLRRIGCEIGVRYARLAGS